MEKPTKLFASCSLLMASLFFYSASVQFNDPDWYFWFPLYASASAVNLFFSSYAFASKIIRKVGQFALWLGVFLFLKVVIEYFRYGLAGFWSLDLGQRVVREKLGSGLVVSSIFLQLQASTRTTSFVEYGMVLLVGFSYGLPVFFFVFLEQD